MTFELDPNYKDVPARIADFKAKHPEGSLRAADPKNPYRIEVIGSQTFIVYTAEAWRTPDDAAPGVGVAWEPVPGKTPYTRDSELQNAETSAWGRAIVAALASESKSVASAEDVRNRQADHDQRLYESQQRDAEAQLCGWPTADERNTAWNALAAKSQELPADEQALIKAEIKKAGVVPATFTPENAQWWETLIALATPKEDVGSGAGADNSVLDPDGGTAKDQPSPLPANNEKAGVA